MDELLVPVAELIQQDRDELIQSWIEFFFTRRA